MELLKRLFNVFLVISALISCGVCSLRVGDPQQNTIQKNVEKPRTLYDYQTRVAAYKDLINSKCLLEFLTNNESIITQRLADNGNTWKPITTSNQLTKREIWQMAGTRISDFCRGFPTYLIKPPPNTLESQNDLPLVRRKRDERHYFVGQIRGQTQSQYLNVEGTSQPGKAEAESSLEGTKAVVTGTNGMGQAQSQSAPIDCSRCFGDRYQDQSLGYGRQYPERLTRPDYTALRPGHRYTDSGNGFESNYPIGPGSIPHTEGSWSRARPGDTSRPIQGYPPGSYPIGPGRSRGGSFGGRLSGEYQSHAGQSGRFSGTFEGTYHSEQSRGVEGKPGNEEGLTPGEISHRPGYGPQPPPGYSDTPQGPRQDGYSGGRPGTLQSPGHDRYTSNYPESGRGPGAPAQTDFSRAPFGPDSGRWVPEGQRVPSGSWPSSSSSSGQPGSPESQWINENWVPSSTGPSSMTQRGPGAPGQWIQPGSGGSIAPGSQWTDGKWTPPGISSLGPQTQPGQWIDVNGKWVPSSAGSESGRQTGPGGQVGQWIDGKWAPSFAVSGSGTQTGPGGQVGQWIDGKWVPASAGSGSGTQTGPGGQVGQWIGGKWVPSSSAVSESGTQTGPGGQWSPSSSGAPGQIGTGAPVGQWIDGNWVPSSGGQGRPGGQWVDGKWEPSSGSSGGTTQTGSGDQGQWSNGKWVPSPSGPSGTSQAVDGKWVPFTGGPGGTTQTGGPGQGGTGSVPSLGSQVSPGSQRINGNWVPSSGGPASLTQNGPSGQWVSPGAPQGGPGGQWTSPAGTPGRWSPGTIGTGVGPSGPSSVAGGSPGTSGQWLPASQGTTGGQPIGPGGQPIGPGGQPIGPGGQPIGPGGQPIGPGGQPIGPGGQPIGPGGQPIGPGGQPIGPGGQPIGPGGQPIGPGGQLIGPGGQPIGPGGQPIGPGGQPIGPGGQWAPGQQPYGPGGSYGSGSYPSGTDYGPGAYPGSFYPGPGQVPPGQYVQAGQVPGQYVQAGQGPGQWVDGKWIPSTEAGEWVNGKWVPAEADDADSQVLTSVQQTNNESITASAQAHGKFQGVTSQSKVSGTYSGTGSFSASAGSDDGKRGALTQVSGGKDGALSSAQGRGGVGQSQAEVTLDAETGDALSSAQTSGKQHGTQTQVHASQKGGLADAQANGPGPTSSQAQIGFTPYDGDETDNQTSPFKGGGTAAAQSGTNTGMTQTQIQGKFRYGIRYQGAAQAGAGSTALRNLTEPTGFFKPLNFTSRKANATRQKGESQSQQAAAAPPGKRSESTPTVENSSNITTTTTTTSPKPAKNQTERDINKQELMQVHAMMGDDQVVITSEETTTLPLLEAEEPEYVEEDYEDEEEEESSSETPRSNELTAGPSRRNLQSPWAVETEPIITKYETLQNVADHLDASRKSSVFSPHSQQQSQHIVVESLQPTGPVKPKPSVVSQSDHNQKQHIVLDPLEDLDATVHQSKGEPHDGMVLQPGQIIPGSPGFQIPAGFRGRVTAIANGPNTYAIGKNAQAQSVTLSPGSGKIHYSKPSNPVYGVVTKTTYKNGQYGTGYSYQPIYHPVGYRVRSGKVLPNFVSVSKSEAGSTDLATGRRKPDVYYTQSSSCGMFTNTCVYTNGRKSCFPVRKTNPDGTPMAC